MLHMSSHHSPYVSSTLILLHVGFPWRRDIGSLSRNNAEYAIVGYATMYIGRFATIKMDCGHCWRVTLLRCANVSMVTSFVVYGVGLIVEQSVFWKSPRVDALRTPFGWKTVSVPSPYRSDVCVCSKSCN
jgi:hypothetical protein